MRVSKLGLKLVTGPRLSFVRVSWPIKHDIAKKIKHHVVIDKTINKNIMSGCFYCFQNKLPSKSVYDKKKKLHISRTTILPNYCKTGQYKK